MTSVLSKSRESYTHKPWVRALTGVLLLSILVPLLLTLAAPMASAKTCSGEDADDDCKDYSLYTLASNASSFFSNASSPDDKTKLKGENWGEVTNHPGRAGSLLGYSDPSFSFSFKWLYSEISGSSQTVEYSSFAQGEKNQDDDKDKASYAGLTDYAHFGAANRDLGFDAMSGSVIDDIIHAIGGSLVFLFYALAIGIGWVMNLFVGILKLLNPFAWFYYGVRAISPTWANGMIGKDGGTTNLGAFDGLAKSIGNWYETLVNLSGNVLIPLFLGAMILSFVFMKQANKGAKVKKMIIRVVFIFVGLPLLGSMYTQVLNKVDVTDSQSAGATKVVLSTYVDFNAWMMNDRLAIPDDAVISWDSDSSSATSDAVLSARTSSLAINAQSVPAFSNLGPVTGKGTNDKLKDAWTNGSPNINVTCQDDETPEEDNCSPEDSGNQITTTMGMLMRYMGSQDVAASDFESGIKGNIISISEDGKNKVSSKDKSKWFGVDSDYGDADDFNDASDPDKPVDQPLISTGSDGLTSSNPGGKSTTFTTSDDTEANCGFRVVKGDASVMNCNMAPLAAYNYLNTKFDSDSLTLFSSNKAMSGISRETHASVSQIGSGPMSFMYWFNTVVMLICVVALGLCYALGMLFGAFKRTLHLVTAIPFATVGVMSGIAKVITYSIALIMEVLGTLFLYNFVSELLISVPTITEGPMGELLNWGPLKSTPALGSILIVIMSVFSVLILIAATFAMIKTRSSVLKAIDEAVTKIVDKFLDTETQPQSGGGLLPAMAGGAGAGAGMALGSNLMNRGKGKSDMEGTPGVGTPGGKGKASGPNAGGTHGAGQLSGKGTGQLPPGGLGGSGGPGGGDPNDPDNPNGSGGGLEEGKDGRALGRGQDNAPGGLLTAGKGGSGRGGDAEGGLDGKDGQSEGRDGKASDRDLSSANQGTYMQSGSAKGKKSGTSSDDRQLADQVKRNGLTGGTSPDAPDGKGSGRTASTNKTASTNLGGTKSGQKGDAAKGISDASGKSDGRQNGRVNGSARNGQKSLSQNQSGAGSNQSGSKAGTKELGAGGNGRVQGKTTNAQNGSGNATRVGSAGSGTRPTTGGGGGSSQSTAPSRGTTSTGSQSSPAPARTGGSGSTPTSAPARGNAANQPTPPAKNPAPQAPAPKSGSSGKSGPKPPERTTNPTRGRR